MPPLVDLHVYTNTKFIPTNNLLVSYNENITTITTQLQNFFTMDNAKFMETILQISLDYANAQNIFSESNNIPPSNYFRSNCYVQPTANQNQTTLPHSKLTYDMKIQNTTHLIIL